MPTFRITFGRDTDAAETHGPTKDVEADSCEYNAYGNMTILELMALGAGGANPSGEQARLPVVFSCPAAQVTSIERVESS